MSLNCFHRLNLSAEPVAQIVANSPDKNECPGVRTVRGFGNIEPMGNKASTILQTERLLLRELTSGDLVALKTILQDEVTMAAYEGPFSDAEVVAWLEKQLANYRNFGFGLWAVVSRGTGEMIGQCGITWQDIAGQRVLEVGYLFSRAYWHQGYATEAAAACRDWAFENLKAEEIFAQVRDTNIASMNVAIRLGMTIQTRFIKHYRGVDMPHLAFSIRREDLHQDLVFGGAASANQLPTEMPF